MATAIILISPPAHATSVECVVLAKMPALDPITKTEVKSLAPGDRIYSTNALSDDRAIIVHDNKLVEVTGSFFGKGAKIDCHVPLAPGYPVVVGSNRHDLTLLYDNFGIWPPDPRFPKINLGNHQSCPFDEDGKIRGDTFAAYEAKGFSLTHLCMVLFGIAIRFDPETGGRLPTFVIDEGHGQISPEYIFEPPSCFARGQSTVNKMPSGLTHVRLHPTGCKFRFHPWSGRKLNEIESELFSRETAYDFTPIKGDSAEDSQSLSKDEGRRISLAKIDALKKQLGNK
jgi:hypothetical protein